MLLLNMADRLLSKEDIQVLIGLDPETNTIYTT